MKYLPAILFCCLCFSVTRAQRPKIGLTLSGGGAKGLAHVGILKAIDSAGLQIDYVTGTSMGSIIGGLYAAGYSGNDIDSIGRKINWDQLLSNQSSLQGIAMEEKEEYDKYIIELPWVNNWFRLRTGVLEGQELWLKFSELFYPLHDIKDFSKFSIPFRCIATDISTGDAVVLDSGEIISAIRASMAIPSIFTAVDYKGMKLVDGGVVRNFPVKDAKQMGANFMIGSDVSGPMLESDKVTNALQVLLQVAFFRNAEDLKEEVPLCNIYVHIPLEDYSMGSFGESDKIIEAGMEEGRKLYPRLKALADSLNAIYGPQPPRKKRLIAKPPVLISSYEVKGLKNTTPEYFIHTMNLLTNQHYTPEMLASKIRHAFGTRYYSRINYSLATQPDGSCKILFDVNENPLTFAKIGLNYNEFSGISAIVNLTSRDFFTPNSRSLVTLNLGQNFRVKAEHLQYFSRTSNFSFSLNTQYDHFNISTYDSQFKAVGLYGQGYFKFDSRVGYATQQNINFGLGTRFEWVQFSPSLNSPIDFNGTNKFTTSYIFFKRNTLDRTIYPMRGMKIDAEAGWVFGQVPNIISQGSLNPDSVPISTRSYARAVFKLETYSKIGSRTTLLVNAQTGVNFNYDRNIMNEFSVGGLTEMFHNEITFAGLKEGSLYTPATAEIQLGIRYQLFTNTYLIGRANTLFNNFISKSDFFKNPDFLSGYALTFAYNFVLGPLELSAMYCDQSRTVAGYINIGIPF